jgi:hypothetical protein
LHSALSKLLDVRILDPSDDVVASFVNYFIGVDRGDKQIRIALLNHLLFFAKRYTRLTLPTSSAIGEGSI